MQLKIKPSRLLCDFVYEIPDDVDCPTNIQNLRKSQKKRELKSADIRWLGNYLKTVLNWSDVLKKYLFLFNFIYRTQQFTCMSF